MGRVGGEHVTEVQEEGIAKIQKSAEAYAS